MSTRTEITGDNEVRADLRGLIDRVCADFPSSYWRELDENRAYPEKFVDALTSTGLLGALIPEEFGGLGLGVAEASVIVEQINRNGGNAAAVHAQLYTMSSVLRHGSDEQRSRYLPKIATGELRLQAFGITEPIAGTDTTNIRTFARKDGDSYVLNGQKIWTSRFQHSDLMLVLARTTPVDQVEKKSHGLSLFLVDLHETEGVTARPIDTMVNHETNEVFYDDARVPASALVGEQDKGFQHVLDAINPERILIAAECIGDGRWFVERASRYACERVVFDRPIGQNQGVQFPIAQAHVHVEAADLMRWRSAALYDAGLDCGAEANMAKLLAADASWEAANVAMQTHGGFGMAAEYDVERKFRETRLYQIAPVSTNLILAHVGQHVLGMPRSF
jgi:acyl-CoA dehydrogenase